VTVEDDLVDPEALAQLAHDMGDAALVEVLQAAAEELPELADRSERASEAGDLTEVARACHALTSAAALVGAGGVAALAGDLEHAVKSGRPGDVKTAAARISGAVGTVVAVLTEEIGRRDGNTV
jgi:HPt (histidine-containing phosphotransfer) domain-containing protein